MTEDVRTESIGPGKILHDVNEFIFVKNKKITSIISAVLIVGLTFLVFNAEANAKASEMLRADDIKNIIMRGGSGIDDLFNEIDGFVERQTQRNVADTISQGQSAPPVMLNNSMERVLRSIEIDMTWTDESDPPGIPRIRDYENLPDEFSVVIRSGNGTTIISARSDSGFIRESYELTNQEMEGSFGAGDFIMTITLENAGDWVPKRGPGVIRLTDDENSFEMSIKMVHLEPENNE